MGAKRISVWPDSDAAGHGDTSLLLSVSEVSSLLDYQFAAILWQGNVYKHHGGYEEITSGLHCQKVNDKFRGSCSECSC